MQKCNTRNNRQVGSYYEEEAKKYLLAKGYTILAQNYRCKLGEIDLIAQDKEYTVFIEIKYRKNTHCGLPRESVHAAKQRTIRKVATYYLVGRGKIDVPCRFDVIEILENKLTHLYNAFMEG